MIGNVGALAQRSLKRSWLIGLAPGRYLLVGVVVGIERGLEATAFYLAVYLAMNVTAFAVVVARERVSEHGDGLSSFENLGQSNPWLAWPMTIAMLSLAGYGHGRLHRQVLPDRRRRLEDYTWLGIAIVIGSVLSLGYLRVVAAM